MTPPITPQPPAPLTSQVEALLDLPLEIRQALTPFRCPACPWRGTDPPERGTHASETVCPECGAVVTIDEEAPFLAMRRIAHRALMTIPPPKSARLQLMEAAWARLDGLGASQSRARALGFPGWLDGPELLLAVAMRSQREGEAERNGGRLATAALQLAEVIRRIEEAAARDPITGTRTEIWALLRCAALAPDLPVLPARTRMSFRVRATPEGAEVVLAPLTGPLTNNPLVLSIDLLPMAMRDISEGILLSALVNSAAMIPQDLQPTAFELAPGQRCRSCHGIMPFHYSSCHEPEKHATTCAFQSDERSCSCGAWKDDQ